MVVDSFSPGQEMSYSYGTQSLLVSSHKWTSQLYPEPVHCISHIYILFAVTSF